MKQLEAKQLIPDKSYVRYAGGKYKVAEIKTMPGNAIFIGIYDEPPSLHVDYLNADNVEFVKEWLDESPTSPPTAHTEELSTPPVREVKSAEEVVIDLRNESALYAKRQGSHDKPDITAHDFFEGAQFGLSYASQFTTPHKEGYSVEGWVRVEDYNNEKGRLLVFSPVYKDNDPMRYRLIDSQFLPTCKDVTHYQLPSPPNSLTN